MVGGEALTLGQRVGYSGRKCFGSFGLAQKGGVMRMPDVVNQLTDPDNEIVYLVYAYRTLTQAETINAVGQYLRRKKKPKRGSRIEIFSVIGTRD